MTLPAFQSLSFKTRETHLAALYAEAVGTLEKSEPTMDQAAEVAEMSESEWKDWMKERRSAFRAELRREGVRVGRR